MPNILGAVFAAAFALALGVLICPAFADTEWIEGQDANTMETYDWGC